MAFQTAVATVLAPVAALQSTDTAAAILDVAEALQSDLALSFQIDTLRLRLEMEHAFGGPDATGAWDWKLAYEACEAALVLILRKFDRALLARAGSLVALQPILSKVSGCCRRTLGGRKKLSDSSNSRHRRRWGSRHWRPRGSPWKALLHKSAEGIHLVNPA